MTVVAILLGVVIAAIGFIPLLFGMKKARRVAPDGAVGLVGPLLLTIFVSFVILAAALVVCAKVAHPYSLPFAAGEIVAFIVIVIVYGFVNNKRTQK